MYRLIKKIVYLFTFYCCLDFLFFDFPVPAVSFPDRFQKDFWDTLPGDGLSDQEFE